VAEHAVLDLVPLARAWRVVADVDRQPGIVSEALQLAFPQSGAIYARRLTRSLVLQHQAVAR